MVANFLSNGFIFVSVLTRNIPVVWFPIVPSGARYVLDAHFASRRRLLLVADIGAASSYVHLPPPPAAASIIPEQPERQKGLF